MATVGLETRTMMERTNSNLHKRKEHAIVVGRQDTQHQIVLTERRQQGISGACAKQ